jgi:hypothetical protein
MGRKTGHNRSRAASGEHPQARTVKAQALFLVAFAEYLSIRKACEVAGISRSTYYGEWRQSEDFKQRVADAEQDAVDLAAEELLRRAVRGVEKPVFYRGSKCGAIREFSDTLLLAFMKAHRPELYRDRASVEHSGKVTLEQVLDASRGDGATP